MIHYRVKVKKSCPMTGVKKGEEYWAHQAPGDQDMAILDERIPDGHYPQVKEYWKYLEILEKREFGRP